MQELKDIGLPRTRGRTDDDILPRSQGIDSLVLPEVWELEAIEMERLEREVLHEVGLFHFPAIAQHVGTNDIAVVANEFERWLCTAFFTGPIITDDVVSDEGITRLLQQ